MRRFEPAGSLNLVAPKDFCVRGHDQFCFFTKIAAGKSAGMSAKPWPGSIRGRIFETVFPPNFREPLTLALIVAKDMDGVILARPAMELSEEFAALGLGYLRFGRALRHRAECVEAFEMGSVEWGMRRLQNDF